MSIGNFHEGELCDGDAIFSWSNGHKYIGHIVNTVERDGKGTYYWPSGVIYCGEFKLDVRHGFGKMTWPTGFSFEGEWTSGQPTGLNFPAFFKFFQ
jgi:hypothetical protein